MFWDQHFVTAPRFEQVMLVIISLNAVSHLVIRFEKLLSNLNFFRIPSEISNLPKEGLKKNRQAFLS